MKDRLIKELQEKIDLRERQISKMEKEIRDLENNLVLTNEKRFKLQETIGSMEKELQSTKAHVNQLADINTRYDIGMKPSSSCSSINTHKTGSYSTNFRVPTQGIDSQSTLNHSNSKNEIGLDELNLSHMDCKSLIGLSLKQIDYLRTRLNNLSNFTSTSSKNQKSRSPSLKKIHSNDFNNIIQVKSSHSKLARIPSTKVLAEYTGRHKNLAKVMELTAKRYEHLQQQAYESYEELTNLLKLAVSR